MKKDTTPEQRLAKQVAFNNCNRLREILEANIDVSKRFDFPLVYFFFFSNFLGKIQLSTAVN